MSDFPDTSVVALRRLARGLLYDRHGAEDVVQEAWLAALNARPPGNALVVWLTGAVRNLARNRKRDEARRHHRERSVARPEAETSSGELAAHLEILRRLLDALERLDEPYRTAVALRYLEEAPPREIARRLGLPVNTARTHVRRGLERLRRELDGGRGEDRQGLLAALVPLAGGKWVAAAPSGLVPSTSAVSPSAIGVTLMQKKLALFACLLVLALGVAYFVERAEDEPTTRDAGAEAALAELPGAEPRATGSNDASTTAQSSAPSQREPASEPPTATGTWIVRGHALQRAASLPDLPLNGRVFLGGKAEGTPVIDQTFRTDASGDFAWALELPTELVTVEVRPLVADAIALPQSDVFMPGDPAPERWVVSVYPLDCTVRGLVSDPDGRPVAGALVRERDRMEEQGTTTDAEGRYALRVTSGDELALRVRAAGFAQTTIRLDVQTPGEVAAPEIVLAPELRVRGRVVDVEGAPIAGVRVSAEHPFFGEETTSGEDGTFELGTLDNDASYLSILAQKAGYAAVHEQLEPSERAKPLELVLARGVRVTGRIVGPDRMPVWGAWVTIGFHPWPEPRLDTHTDRNGRFEIADVPVGIQLFWLWRTGLAWQRAEVAIPADDTFHVEFALEEDHFVGGVVLDEAGTPMPWASVYAEDGEQGLGGDLLQGFQTRTGPDGRFRFDGLPAVPVKIGALAEGRARLEQVVHTLDRDDVVLRMSRSAALAGTVVDAASGAPIPNFVVRVGFPPAGLRERAATGYPAMWTSGVAFSDPDGQWRLENDFEPDRVAAVTIEADGYAPATVDAVETALDANPADFVVRLLRGTAVRGRVVEKATGAPVAGARVRRVTARVPYESLKWTEEPVAEATTDVNGRFELVDVPTGSMGLAVEHSDWTVCSDGPFDVGSAPIERIVELSRGATVEGRLLDAERRPLAGEKVSIYGLDGLERTHERAVTTGDDGRFHFAGLAAGEYHLRWERTLGERKVYDLLRYLDLAGEDVREIDLVPEGKATLIGTIECDGVLPDVVTVMIMPQSDAKPKQRADGTWVRWALGGRATFAENGAFSLTPLAAGTYSVMASYQSPDGAFSMGNAKVDVPEAGVVEVHVRLERRR